MMEINEPIAKKFDHVLEKHGDRRNDPYYWLNQRENPDVINYLNAENDYTNKVLSNTKTLQEKIFTEIVGRIKQTDMSVPYKDNGYYYITRYEEGKEHPIYGRKRDNLNAPEEIMLDLNELAKPYEYYNVAGRSVSPDNRILTYGEDTLSRRIYTLRFKNLETGEMLPDRISNTTGSCVWANDNKTIFYTRKDETLRAFKVFRHTLGSDAQEDVEIYHEIDETFNIDIFKTKSKKYIVIGSYATLANEYRLLHADDPDGTFSVFIPREHKHEHFIDHAGDKFFIRTNWDAINFRLMQCDEDNTTQDQWKEVIAHRPAVLLDDMDFFKDYWVLSERVNGLTQLHILDTHGQGHYIDFGQEAFTAYTSVNRDYDTQIVRIAFTSLTTPNTTYDYNMSTKEMALLKQEEVVGSFDPQDYVTERFMATARDGVKVPISMVYKKGFKRDGTQPLLLYGYGSYGISIDPTFNSARLSLIDRGFAFAIAHIRGGQEMGRQWYEDGKFLKKKNTFTDFIDCAQYLIDEKYCNSESLFAMGGSAGGLLIGAVINMAPQLFKGVLAAVPFVDVVTTMLDESIPLTTGEYDEWGNPNDKLYYDYMKSYSPYDNVAKKDYPALMVTTGLHDSQVQYWEPAKWVAKLREYKTDKNPLLMYTNMDTGHGGASGRFERHKETAMEYAFFLELAGKRELID
jgi:oligopeptidase B